MKMIEKCYPAFEALILRDLMFNRSLKSGLVSFCMREVKGKHITHLLTMSYASNHWEALSQMSPLVLLLNLVQFSGHLAWSLSCSLFLTPFRESTSE